MNVWYIITLEMTTLEIIEFLSLNIRVCLCGQTNTNTIGLLLVQIRNGGPKLCCKLLAKINTFLDTTGHSLSYQCRNYWFLAIILEISWQFIAVNIMPKMYRIFDLFSVLSTHIILLFFKDS